MQSIYIDIDEELTSIIDKMKRAEEHELALVIPRRASVIQSSVNLQILKRQAERLGRDVVVVTKDETGKNLAARIGFTVREQLDGKDVEPFPLAGVGDGPQVRADWLSDRNDNGVPDDMEEGASLPFSDTLKEESSGKSRKMWLLPRVSMKMLLFVFLPSIAVLGVLGWLVLPSAAITVSPIVESVTRTVLVRVDSQVEGLQADITTIPGTVVEVEKSGSETYASSGKKTVGEKSTGTVRIVNSFSSDPQVFAAGTELVTADGLTYMFPSRVTVPGARIEEGEAVSGVIDVTISASEFGEEYNKESGSISIVGLSASQQRGIDVSLRSPLAGGSAREVRVVSQDDLQRARDEIEARLEQELVAGLSSQAGEDVVLIEGARELETVQATSSVPVDQEADEFEFTVVMKVKGLIFSEADANTLALEQLSFDLPADRVVVDDVPPSFSYSFSQVDVESGAGDLEVFVERKVADEVDVDTLRARVLGLSGAELESVLAQEDGISAHSVEFWPFWVDGVPRFEQKVDLMLDFSLDSATI